MSNPKRHHFLPQFYLEAFCSNGLLWLRDCKTREVRQQTPKNTALIGYYYSIEVGGARDHSVERWLSQVEGHAKPIIQALVRGESIDQTQKDQVALFISLLWNRVPDFQRTIEKIESFMIKDVMTRMFRSKEAAAQSMKRYEQETGKSLEADAEGLFEFASKGQFDVGIHRNESIRMMLEQSEGIANYFRQLTWVVAHCPSTTSFITTDNPLVLSPPPDFRPALFHSACGIITPGCEKIVPLSQSCCLFMLDRGDETVHREINRARTRAVNQLLASKVQRYVISRDEALVLNLATIADKASRSRDGRVIIG